MKKIFVFVGHISSVHQYAHYRITRCIPLMGKNFNVERPLASWKLEGYNDTKNPVSIATGDDVTLLAHYAKGLGIPIESINATFEDHELIAADLMISTYLEVPVVMQPKRDQELWPVGEALPVNLSLNNSIEVQRV